MSKASEKKALAEKKKAAKAAAEAARPLTEPEIAARTKEFMGALAVMTRLNLNPSSAKVLETMVGFYS